METLLFSALMAAQPFFHVPCSFKSCLVVKKVEGKYQGKKKIEEEN